MDKLRSDCPWNHAQTIDTLRPMTIEEVYELSDAVLKKDETAAAEGLPAGITYEVTEAEAAGFELIGVTGNTGEGMAAVKTSVEKAVGSDIFNE